MRTGRLEAFSDGVLAIIITIMVLEMKVPQRDGLESLNPLYPVAISYVLSFISIGVYWNNHHHLLSKPNLYCVRVVAENLHKKAFKVSCKKI